MRRLGLALLVLLVTVAAAGCAPATIPQPAPASATVAPTAAAPAEDSVVLDVVGVTETIELTMDEMRQLPRTEGMAGIKSSTGEITPPRQFAGVAVTDLLSLVDGFGEDSGVVVQAKDGYSITFSHGQVSEGAFIAYDPVAGDEVDTSDLPLTLIVAYEDEGEPIPDTGQGPLRMMVVSPEGKQVVDGHWAVKWVRHLTVKEMSQEWTLEMEGAITQTMDRGTFESGAAPDCHQSVWIDEAGQEWVGVPLWRLAGWVDDDIKHEGPAFSDELASMGYEIEVIASDGYSVTLDSDRVTRHDEVLVAYLVNGAPLPEKYFPLRLVGEGLEKGEMVGAIATIRLHLPEVEPAPAAPVDLLVTGLVAHEFGLSKDNLSRMEMVTISAQHPKSDAPSDYTGVPLVHLLGQAEPDPEAETLSIVAFDGYSADVDLSAVLECSDCLIAFDETGKLRTIMPGMEGSAWGKDVVRLEVKTAGAAPAEPEAAEAESEEPSDVETVAIAPEVGLEVSGLVTTELSLSPEDLAAMPAVAISAQHPKKDEPEDFAGLRLSDLLALAEPVPEAETLVIVASDGYQSEVPLAAVADCADCLVAVDEGLLRMVMPGSESSAWVKDVVALQVK